MDEYNKYAALANTIQIEDITLSERKRNILQRLKDNDESFDKLWICTKNQIEDYRDYSPDSDVELAWLGYFLGSNSTTKELHISSDLTLFNKPGKDVFLRGLGNNKSIHRLDFDNFNLSEGRLFSMMNSFLKDNNNLSEIVLEGCEFGSEGLRQLSLVTGNCNQSLKRFILSRNQIGDGHLVDIITALSMHPQLTNLCLSDNGTIGRNECTALSTLLQCTTTQLQRLDLRGCNIDDEGVDILVNALTSVNTLQTLDLSSNPTITIKGWKILSTLLEAPDSKLKTLYIYSNNIGNDGALVFANALLNNNTLTSLDLDYCVITPEGWAHFSKLFCDTSSINNTYLSNHALGIMGRVNNAHVNKYLLLNKREDKQQVAMSKILQRHSHFDMQPFFEWEFKVLPIMIKWFTKAAARVTTYEQKISRLRLSATFDFIKEFPMLYIEPVTRKEISEYTAMEEQLLQGGQVGSAPGHLEAIRRCKARAMRRL